MRRLILLIIDGAIIYYAVTHHDLIAWICRLLILLVFFPWLFLQAWPFIKRCIWLPKQSSFKQKIETRYQQSYQQSPVVSTEPDRTDYYLELLALVPGYTKKELERNYRLKMKEYHPDKLPPSVGKRLREYAEFMSKEINAAYDHLLKKLDTANH